MPIKTKKAIAEAFGELMKKKSVDKITVKDVSDVCGISRQSFYYHFQDIPDLIEWIMEQGIQQAAERSVQEENEVDALMHFVSLATENHELIRRLMESQYHERFRKLLMNGMQTYLAKVIRHRFPDISVRSGDAETALQFYSGGLASVLIQYNKKESPDARKLSEQLCRLLLDKPYQNTKD